jgi:hypothetical protein
MSYMTTLCHFRLLILLSVFSSLLYLAIFPGIIVAKLDSYVKMLNSCFVNDGKGDYIFFVAARKALHCFASLKVFVWN